MLTVASDLLAAGARVDLVLVSATGPLIPTIPQGMHVLDLKKSRALYAVPELSLYLRRSNPDIMLTALPHVNSLAIVAKYFSFADTKVILTEHNTLSQVVTHAATLRGRLLPFIMRHLYPLADHIVAVSQGVKNDIQDFLNLDSKTISVIFNPVVTSQLLIDSERFPNHPWFLDDTVPIILGAGRLTQAKDFATLIRAFSIVRKTRHARLVILGEGHEKESLQTLADELDLTNHIFLPGFVTNPHGFMKKAAVFVLSSLWEGLPTVLIEALACGTPVVSTDCPSGPSEILEGGRLGHLVPISDEGALAEAILNKLQSPGNKADSAVIKRYSQETTCHQYQKLIMDISTKTRV
jgi:glycosyltransferase involved in cell wall biosynthesis